LGQTYSRHGPGMRWSSTKCTKYHPASPRLRRLGHLKHDSGPAGPCRTGTSRTDPHSVAPPDPRVDRPPCDTTHRRLRSGARPSPVDAPNPTALDGGARGMCDRVNRYASAMCERGNVYGGEGRIRTSEGIPPADLQSAPFGRLGTSPILSECRSNTSRCQRCSRAGEADPHGSPRPEIRSSARSRSSSKTA
jgi:hypothetical protein